jgi:hypothetical protein
VGSVADRVALGQVSSGYFRLPCHSFVLQTSNYFKRFFPFESSGDIVHGEKSGRFDVDVVLP